MTSRIVIDAPTLLHVVRHGPEVAADLVAPAALRSEALELLYAEVRAGTTTEKEARRLHTAVTEQRARLLNDRVSRWTAFQIAYELDLPDLVLAAYLAVTRLQADAFVTVDAERARIAADVVPVATLDDLA